MRSKLLTTALLIALPLFLTACNLQDLPVIGKYLGGNNPNNGPVTLNVWGMWESPEIMNELISKYQVEHPNVTINYDDRSVMGATQYKETVYGRIGQDDVADVVLLHNTWVSSLKDSLTPLSSKTMDGNLYEETFYPVASISAVVENEVYAMPAYYDGLVLVYNKDHFAEIDQALPPTSWTELSSLAKELTVFDAEENGMVRGGIAFGAADNVEFSSDILGMLLLQAGVSIPNGLDTKAAADALEFYTQFVTIHKVWSPYFPEAATSFAQERVSMILVPSWNLIDIIKVRPDLNIGVAPIPQVSPESPLTWASFWMYGVPKTSKNADTAWDFINFLASEEQEVAKFNAATMYRPFGAPYSLVSLGTQIQGTAYEGYLKPLLDTAPFARSSIVASRSGNDKYSNALNEAISSVLQGTKPDEAMKTAKQKMLEK